MRVHPCPSVVPFFSCFSFVSWFFLLPSSFIICPACPGPALRPGHALYDDANCQRTNCEAANTIVCRLDFGSRTPTLSIRRLPQASNLNPQIPHVFAKD